MSWGIETVVSKKFNTWKKVYLRMKEYCTETTCKLSQKWLKWLKIFIHNTAFLLTNKYFCKDYLPHASPRTALQTTGTEIRGTSSTPSGTHHVTAIFPYTKTSPPTGPPEVSIPSDPKNSSVLVTILVCLALLIILGAAALLYRRYR